MSSSSISENLIELTTDNIVLRSRCSAGHFLFQFWGNRMEEYGEYRRVSLDISMASEQAWRQGLLKITNILRIAREVVFLDRNLSGNWTLN